MPVALTLAIFCLPLSWGLELCLCLDPWLSLWLWLDPWLSLWLELWLPELALGSGSGFTAAVTAVAAAVAVLKVLQRAFVVRRTDENS